MARPRIVHLVNRTTEPLDCMYDGIPEVIPPGYQRVEKDGAEARVVGANEDGTPYQHAVEYFSAEAYKRQHPRMGTQDPFSVDARDTEYLLGIPEWGDEISHAEQTAADELIDRTMLPPQRQQARTVTLGRSTKDGAVEGGRDVRTKRAAKEARKVRVKQKALAQENRRARYRDSQMPNPMGMKATYEDAPS